MISGVLGSTSGSVLSEPDDGSSKSAPVSEEECDMIEWLRDVYRAYNPAKLGEIDRVLDTFRDAAPGELVKLVQKKYLLS